MCGLLSTLEKCRRVYHHSNNASPKRNHMMEDKTHAMIFCTFGLPMLLIASGGGAAAAPNTLL